MLLKLAADQTADRPQQLRGKSAVFGNYLHPAPAIGGITGSFIGSELADKALGGNTIEEIVNVSKKVPVKAFGKTLFHKTVQTPVLSKATIGLGKRFGKNMFRGVGGIVGAGLGATAAMALSKKKD